MSEILEREIKKILKARVARPTVDSVFVLLGKVCAKSVGVILPRNGLAKIKMLFLFFCAVDLNPAFPLGDKIGNLLLRAQGGSFHKQKSRLCLHHQGVLGMARDDDINAGGWI